MGEGSSGKLLLVKDLFALAAEAEYAFGPLAYLKPAGPGRFEVLTGRGKQGEIMVGEDWKCQIVLA